jgi:hypothetical protein
MTVSGLAIIAQKPPIVATHVGEFDGNYTETLHRYQQEAVTIVRMAEIQQYQHKLLETILSPKTTLGCLVAPFGYGKTSTAIGLWQAASETGLLAVPPFSCSSVAEMAQTIATGVQLALRPTQPEAAAKVQAAYDVYLVSSAERLAQQDVAEYGISPEMARRSIQDKLARGLLTLEASSTHLLKFLDQLVEISVDTGFAGLFVIVDEFQQFLGNVNKAVITNFRTLVWGLKTRRNQPFGFLFTMDPDTERTLSDRAGDILHRIKEDGLYFNFANIYDREFPRLLWDRYSTAFGFQADSPRIVNRATLEAIGQICERPDLSNGPRTVINAFQQIAAAYTIRSQPYSPMDMIDDFLTGAIKFDGDRNIIASLVTELTGYDYIRRSPNRVNVLKLIAAFPRGCAREIAQHYALADTFDQLADELRGEILTELPEGVALIDLQRVGKPQNKLNIILKKYWLQITEAEIVSDRILTLFGRYVIDPLFPAYANATSGWQRTAEDFVLTPVGGYWQIYEGTSSREYPARRVCVQICRDPDHAVDPFGLTDELDLNLVFVLYTSGEETKGSRHFADHHTLVLHLPLHQPFHLPLPRDVRWIEDYLRPVVMTPAVLLSLLNYIDRQLPILEGLTAAEEQRIADTYAKLRDFLHTMLVDETLFSGLGTPIIARGAPALTEALFTICRSYYPDYRTLITLANWESLLKSYQQALNALSLLQRRGIEPLVDSKANIAGLFGQRNHAGFQSQAKQFDPLLTVSSWAGSQGTVSFQQHPGEIYLYNCVARNREMSRDDLLQAGRQAGYTFGESEYLLEFLQLRGYLEFLPAQAAFRSVSTLSYAELDDLSQMVQRELALHATITGDADLKLIEADIAHLQHRLQENEQLGDIQVRLLHQQQRLHKERDRLAQHLRTQLTTIHDQLHQTIEHLKKPLPLLSGEVVLATHLNGAQRTIAADHPPAIKRLESSVVRLAEFLQQPFDLAEASFDHLETFVSAAQTLRREAVEQQQQAQRLVDRAQLYRQWVGLLEEVQRAQTYLTIAAQIVDIASLQDVLEEMVAQIRSDFATIGVKGLLEMYERYAPRLQKLSAEIHTAVYLAGQSAASPTTELAETDAPTNSQPLILALLGRHSALTLTELLSQTDVTPEQLIRVLISLERSQAITTRVSSRHESA